MGEELGLEDYFEYGYEDKQIATILGIPQERVAEYREGKNDICPECGMRMESMQEYDEITFGVGRMEHFQECPHCGNREAE